MAAGPDSTTVAKLVFGENGLEVPVDMGGGLEALTAEVEAKLGLHPGSFSIFDEFGKVDDSAALQRALDMACVLEVREAPEWQKIREMDAKINMLVARCPVVDSVLTCIEERSAKRFEKVVSALQGVEERATLRAELAAAELRQGLEELDMKVDKSIAPLLKCVALQEMELKEKLDSLNASMLSQELDAKVNSGIAPLLQSVALQQMDLKDKLESDLADLQADADKADLQQVHIWEVTKDLDARVDAGSDRLNETCEQLKALQAEVNNLTEGGDIMSAVRQDLGKSPKCARNGAGEGEAYNQWIEGSGADGFSGIAYSKKQTGMTYNSLNIGGAGAVPFARFIAPRQIDRLQGSRSLPHLARVK